MAKAKPRPKQKDAVPSSHRVVIPQEGLEIDLRDRWLAAFLAWLVPGLGHLYQRRTNKGLLFMICILGTFFFGMYLGRGKVVYASLPDQDWRWQYWCQAPAGLPALPALMQRELIKAGKAPMFGGWMVPPRPWSRDDAQEFTSEDLSGNQVVNPDELSKWHHDNPFYFELGTVYTMIAGLLNVLVIYDAAAGPLIILPDPRKKKRKRPENSDGEQGEPPDAAAGNTDSESRAERSLEQKG